MIEDTAKKIFDILHQFYSDRLYPAFISLMKLLAHNRDALWILIAVVVVLSIVRSRVKANKILPGALDAVNGCLVILILIVAFFRFGPTVSDYLGKYNSTSKSSTTKTSQPASQNQNTSKPSQQTTKQLYYSVSCYNCYADGCSRNGYNYGGYSAEYYSYYRNICQNCRCTDFKSQSFWK